MDNRTLDIVSEGDAPLGLALKLAWSNASGGKATHYKIAKLHEHVEYFGQPTSRHHVVSRESPDGTPTLILLWHEEKGALPLPYPMELDEAIPFVIGWLKKAPYGEQPDHDGDNGAGWRVYTEAWGHVAGHAYAIVGVQPAWAMYGK